MLTLADIQAGIRDALVNGNSAAVAPVLLGGTHPEHRLAIHQRHYVASLTRALVERFPATVWLVGSELVTHAATSFIREHPPSRPCIAEYGDGFPRYLGAHPAAGSSAVPGAVRRTGMASGTPGAGHRGVGERAVHPPGLGTRRADWPLPD